MSYTPQFLSGNQIREQFLNFYAQREHKILPSASLIPEDPTVLLTIAGMLPFKPIFLGQKASDYKRATTSQKCIRTNDIENVGRTARHHTFFEMLGNFSFGDYFKEQAIAWAWELSTQVFGLPPERLVISVFREDDEALAIWRDKIGISPRRLVKMDEADNFWQSGPTGPCGPCSEIYYDFHPELGDEQIDLEDDTRFIEFYNLVFMQYNRDHDGNLTPLQAKNIDTGLGLERMAQILQGVPNNYETDLILPIIKIAAQLANVDYTTANESAKVSLKVIGDHVRAIVHMIADGISAANIGRGYVLRRLIRRVVRHGRLLGIESAFITKVAATAIALGQDVYPNLKERQELITAELAREEARFLETLERGEKLLLEILNRETKQISGIDAFTLYDTYGFPLELTQEIAQENNLTVDEEGFAAEMLLQRQRSQSAHETIDLTIQGSLDQLAAQIHPTAFIGYDAQQSQATVTAILVEGKTVTVAEAGTQLQIVLDQTPFYAESGGQIGDRGYFTGDNLLITITDVQKESAMFIHFGRIERGVIQVEDKVTAAVDRTCRRRAQANHTATHLLQAALKQIVGDSISQAGSLVAFDRLRFDFNCPRALTPTEIQQVEEQINTWIAEAHPTQTSVMSLSEAKTQGAIAMFGEKYGTEVRVIDVPGVSMELCGGTHVGNTAEIGVFKIVTETGIASGIRRIEAIAGPGVLEYLNIRDNIVKELEGRFKVKPEGIIERINTLQNDLKTAQKERETLEAELAILKSSQLEAQAETIGGIKVLVAQLPGANPEALKIAAERLLEKLGDAAIVLGSIPEPDKVSLVAAFSTIVHKEKQLNAGKFIGAIASICGGGGGGRPNLAQAGGKDPSKLTQALTTAKQELAQSLQNLG
jgi:alanyl-tRNA synthetase